MMKLLPTMLLMLFLATVAHGQTIGVFADSAGTNCSLEFPSLGFPVTVYVVGTLVGPASPGATSAILRIEGLPDGWTVDVTAAPSAVVAVGNPFDEGITLAYSSCLTNERLTLMTIDITPNSVVEEAELSVLTHSERPRGCGFEGEDCGPCARFCGCGSLFIPCYCARGITSIINGGSCAVALSDKTWGHLKRIYR
jgi:hypothetical protein